jgi:hypothetical protein
MEFTACKADPDIWLREETKGDGTEYCKDIPSLITADLQEDYKYCLKDIGQPNRYLGAEIGRYLGNHRSPEALG